MHMAKIYGNTTLFEILKLKEWEDAFKFQSHPDFEGKYSAFISN